ncbi:MAG: ATP-dependent DNA helicase RecQ [Thermoleophilaceae bacterium]
MDLDSALAENFGFPGFRRGQREACEAALAGRDALVVMPTGSGKSLCYQLPALLRDDLAIVVSPLVALMQDQVEALAARGLGERVALVNAQQDASANSRALTRAADGSLRLLYVAPERFSSPGFLDKLRGVRVGLFVVDEAHCVSQWGHDFRPDYFRLADAARHLGAASLFASTATATPRVATDVVRRLGLREVLRVVTGFDRPNLSFTVVRPGGSEKRTLLVEALRAPDALPAIVYAGTRAGSEEVAEELSAALGEEALAYHAGLERAHRADVQRRFLADDVRVVVATNAFGMGVDKPNVRTVVHASVPSSLEAYYQEAGRGGRDGAPARALLLAEARDKALHVHFIKRDELDEGLPGRLARLLENAARRAAGPVQPALDGSTPAPLRYDVAARELARDLRCSADQLRALLGHLARAGAIQPAPSAPDRVAGRIEREFDRRVDTLCRASIADAARARWRQYRESWAYVEGADCRRGTILRHFGDSAEPAPEGPCCDICDPSLAPVAPPPDPVTLESLDDAIISVARGARPAVGRTTCAEILHGARTKKIARNAYDGLPAYGSSARRRRAEILARIDELIDDGKLATSGGAYPVLRVRA